MRMIAIAAILGLLGGCSTTPPCDGASLTDPRPCGALTGPLGNDANGEDPNAAEGGGSDQ